MQSHSLYQFLKQRDMRLKVLEAEEEERGRGSSRTGSSCSGDARLWKTEEWEGRRGYGDYA